MRLIPIMVLTVLAGCFEASRSKATTAGDDDGGSGAGPLESECITDDHCTLAAATCCECPSFATGTADPVFESCAEVVCPPPECATNVRATCLEHRCAITCAPVACETSCTNGYATDPYGCVTCTCAAPTMTGCSVDTDCTRVGADCCGCERGGMDTAVLVSEAGLYQEMLDCSSSSQCPSVNTCQPDAVPRCIQGVCELSASALPAGACGRPDLPACAAGQQCLVNTNDDASMLGVGVCGTL